VGGPTALLVLVVACGGAPTQVSFVSNEQPNGYTAAQGEPPRAAAHHENPNGGMDLGEDELVEPDRPAASTKAERALVHIHGPKDRRCSGVVVGPRLVATAQRCLRGVAQGVSVLGPEQAWRVEVASSTLTWTNRKAKLAVLPQCDVGELDVAVLVLEEAIPSLVTPLRIVSAPNTGGLVQALGYGRCVGSKKSMSERNGTVRSRVSQAVVIDVPLCKGDVGGPVVTGPEGEGDVVGLISHRDDPEGSPLRTATIARLDTTFARDLLVQAKSLADGGDPAAAQAIACR
jgi:hypothetical protein